MAANPKQYFCLCQIASMGRGKAGRFRPLKELSMVADGVAHRLSIDELPACRLLIAGAWTDGGTTVTVPDKYRLQPAMAAHLPTRAQVSACVAAANAAFRADTLTPYDRGVILDRTAEQVEKRAADWSMSCAGGGLSPDAMRSAKSSAVPTPSACPLRRRAGSAARSCRWRRARATRPHRFHPARAARGGLRDHAVQRAAQHCCAQSGPALAAGMPWCWSRRCIRR